MSVRRLAAASLGLGVAALVLGSSLGTGALWRTSVTLDGGEIRSGELSLLTGDGELQVADYAFDELTGDQLRPGSSVQAPLTVSNGGSADLTYRLSATAASGPDLAAALQLQVSRVTAESACATGTGTSAPVGLQLYAGPFTGASTTTGRFLAPAGREVLCLRLVVSAAAPASTQLVSTRLVFTFAAVSA